MTSKQTGQRRSVGSITGWLVLVLALAVVFAGCGSDDPGPGPNPVPEPDPDPEDYIGPVVTLISPARAGMIEKGTLDDCPVEITGRVCDDVHTISYLEIDGSEVTLPGTGDVCQTFTLTQDCRYGLNIVKGKAMSNVGSFTYLSHSFIRSPNYFPASTTPTVAARVSDATFLQLGQDFFDDGDREDLDDIASIAEYAIGLVDIPGLVPSFQFAKPDGNGDGQVDTEKCWTGFKFENIHKTGYRIRSDGDFTLASVGIDLDLVQGGLKSTITLWNPSMPVYVHGYWKECPLHADKGLHGRVSASSIKITSEARVSVDKDGATVVTFADSKVETSGFSVDMDLGFFSFMKGAINGLAGDALNTFNSAIQDKAAGALNGVLGDYLGDAISGNLFIANKSITLPKLGTKLLVDAGVETIEFTPERAWLSGYTFVRPEKPSAAHASVPYGAPRYGGNAPELSADTVYGVAIKDDFLNQFLWAVWLAGVFDIPDLGADGVSIDVFSSLPPVVMSRVGQMAFDVGWGDLRVNVEMSPTEAAALGLDESDYMGLQRISDGMIEIEAYVSAYMSFDFAIDQAAYALSPSQNFVDLSLQITKIHDPKALEAFTQMLESKLQGALPQYLAKVLADYPLPKYDVDGIGGLQGQMLKMGVPQIGRQGNYYTLSGNLIPIPKP